MPPKNLEQQTNEEDVFQLLRKQVNSGKRDFSTSKAQSGSKSKEDMADAIIDNANKYFLLKILSPEITDNEKKKRIHKDQLIKIVKIFLVVQFLILAFLLFGTLVMIFYFHAVKNDLNLEYIKVIINFISLYITSVVVELIALLKYIVSNVFDTSITGLVEIYKDTNT